MTPDPPSHRDSVRQTPRPSEFQRKVALVHHWLVGMRGGEKVLEALCELFPDADILTLVCDPDRISETLRRHRIITSFIQRLPWGVKKFRAYLPLFPLAAEQLELSGYGLVITSDASVIKRRAHSTTAAFSGI